MPKKRKRKASKITPPSRPATEALVAFRVDRELAAALKTVPNKSETITHALREHFAKTQYVTCPHCNGRGKIRRGDHV